MAARLFVLRNKCVFPRGVYHALSTTYSPSALLTEMSATDRYVTVCETGLVPQKEIQVCLCACSFLSVCICMSQHRLTWFSMWDCLCVFECVWVAITLSRLATVALAACGWRQTQRDGKQPFTLASPQSGLHTIQAYGGNSVEELTLW